ncbi:MAG: UDP-N-acetylglucosamine diphosphorylase/glucosamine-1-phosphate N-acetyltransferase [Deltaproteobacteria bacterium]|nr:UDP-N-acetylglucosamine diphosphorylase/glucosamine-1-phosphate N-acetyltransferase [Deltaproteobacteria bacterium]
MEPLGAIVLAAGLGKRMRSAQAKVLHLLAGKPLLSRVISAIQPLQLNWLVVVVGHKADEVQRLCGQPGILFARQREQHGTGDAVRAAREHFAGFSGDILITCGDTPLLTTDTLARFLETHRARRVTLSVLTVELEDAGHYGRVIRARDGQIIKIVEARDASTDERTTREINTGIYCVKADFLFAALERLRPANAQGEYYLTDIVAQAVAAGLPTQAVLTTNPHEVEGVNSREELATMEKTRQAHLRRQWMSLGVTLEDPDTVYIGEEVTIGQDTVIGPNTQLKGKTTLGIGCRIDGSAYIENCAIGDGAHVDFSCVLRDCELASHAIVGPFAHVHAGTVLAPHAVIGNFVEVKRSIVGEHTKAKHLAYIGDTEIGRDANIGAGTITCNYDGFTKSKTKIGDRVQVGSDTTLVAPITIHDDVYIATATTVRHNVPAGALVFNTRQEQIREGWTAAKRAKEAARKK